MYKTLLLLSLFFWQLEALDPFIVVTPPKAGTHLLTKALEQLTGKKCRNIFGKSAMSNDLWNKRLSEAKSNNQFIHIHAHPRSEQVKYLKSIGYKVIFLIRDPRDQAISLLYYIDNKHWAFGALSMKNPLYKDLSFDKKLHEIITGQITGFCAVRSLFIKYLPWISQDKQFVSTIRFEDLVGKEGGGSRQRQLKAVKKMAAFLHMNLKDQEIDARSQGLFGKPGEKTFRSGQIGEWRRYFAPKHTLEMEKRFGREMALLGY